MGTKDNSEKLRPYKESVQNIPKRQYIDGSFFHLSDINSYETSDWERQFCDTFDSLAKTRKETDADVDVVMVFALSDERKQAFEALEVPEKERETTLNDKRPEYGFTYQRFQIDELSIAAVTQTQMGMAMASSLVTRAILAFRPKLINYDGDLRRQGRKGKDRGYSGGRPGIRLYCREADERRKTGSAPYGDIG